MPRGQKLIVKMKSNLMECVGCRTHVSRSAQKCPRCKTDDPLGVTCQVCQFRYMKKDIPLTLFRLKYGSSSHCLPSRTCFDQYHYCFFCLAKIYAQPKSLNCSECGGELLASTTEMAATNIRRQVDFSKTYNDKCHSNSPTCPHCGSIFPLTQKRFGSCSSCSLDILDFQRGKISPLNNYRYHDTCAPSLIRRSLMNIATAINSTL